MIDSTSPADLLIHSASPEETETLGRSLGSLLRGGEVILLRGELGSGKTCFAGGVASGLGIREPAVSPTYIILRSYANPRGLTLHHIDFYRLGDDADAEALGIEECHAQDAVALVEWPERCPRAFMDFTLELRFILPGASEDPDFRQIEIRKGGLNNVPAGWPFQG
ncbi:tRNA (adenosine(37)-N6)-threonylcarbamoyltransferase complex ATPase subunit type 1 TsaE [Candidatus Sumerlaeota bacterium]|nr:tRNA (adenosine(37)-N6)-threonylcarbamoyltransferase complex ATPase subunit type 1 TsaE [Candidatus Sumerlaeota bacterium]MBI3735934.1 tRNA (adenosine(37)-N6)-threonylcarbamoyltransferase complex ATPase subunit type 1 TsaE [Candidatus Sumerlaeota bacterium]